MKYYGVSAIALMVGLGACAKNPNPLAVIDTPMIKYKTEKVEAAVKQMPKWFTKLPTEANKIYSVGASSSPDLQLSIDMATLNAKYTLADRINGKLDGMMKTFITRLGTDEDISATTMSEVEKVTKNVIASVDVAGYSPKEVEVYPNGTQFRAFVLLEYSDTEARKIIMNRMMKDKLVYSKIKSTNAFKELKQEVEKSKKEDEASSISNIVKEIDKVSNVTVKKNHKGYDVRKDRPKQGLTVMVRGDDLNGAMRVLKKRMQEEGIFNELRERKGHKTRGEKKRLQRAAGRRRWLKKVDKLKEQGLWNE